MRVKKKFASGAATNYITRTRALKKLQLTLKDFRRLCILKGIYPHEPLHKKKVNKGSTENKVYYYVKDINFLATEPIINKFREYKVFLRKLTTAKAKREEDRVKKLYERRPEYQLDRIVKERYPTFASALRDLDDALCLCFAFATLPHTKIVKTSLVADCRRLTAEFNQYIIESHSLTKAFISIKGIYYEANVMGERVTWLVGHERGIGHVSQVDFSVMATFAEFYVAMLQFVNFRLYQSIGLFYPPQIAFSQQKVEPDEINEAEEEKIYSLGCPLAKQVNENEEEMPDTSIGMDDEGDIAKKVKETVARRSLFTECKFWINREAPKDLLAIIIRNCGGSVSWQNCPGGEYDENDERITHQVIDRPLLGSVDVNRSYVQPQWVVDSFNMLRRLPIERYLPGEVLPPHLSPFSSDAAGQYIPEERISQLLESGHDVAALLGEKDGEKKDEKKKMKKADEEGAETRVDVGRTHRENPQKLLNEQGHNLKMREMMIAKKHKRVYFKIKRGIKRQAREVNALKEKRAKLSRSD